MEQQTDYKEFWKKLKKDISEDLRSRDLSDPTIRITAFERIEELIKYALNTHYTHPHLLMKIEKEELKSRIAKAKKNKSLSGAEDSVINDMYRFFDLYKTEE